MEPRDGAVYGALEQLASDRRRDLHLAARARRTTARRGGRRRLRARGRLARAIGLRPAPARSTSMTCAPRSV